MAYEDYTREKDMAEPNTTLEGDGKGISLKEYDDQGYCNPRTAGLMVSQTGIVATNRKPAGFDGMSTDRSRALGRMKGPYVGRGS